MVEEVKMEVEFNSRPNLQEAQVLRACDNERLVTLDCNHFYSLVKLDIPGDTKPQEITQDLVKLAVQNAMNRLFGEFGSATNVEVLHFESSKNQFVVKCPSDQYVKLHCSLTLAGNYQGQLCYFHILKSSPILMSLLTQSRNFFHSDDD